MECKCGPVRGWPGDCWWNSWQIQCWSLGRCELSADGVPVGPTGVAGPNKAGDLEGRENAVDEAHDEAQVDLQPEGGARQEQLCLVAQLSGGVGVGLRRAGLLQRALHLLL